MQQWFIKACLELLSYDKDVEVVMEFLFGLSFLDMAAIRAHVQSGFRIGFIPEDDFAALDRMVTLIEPHVLQQHGVYRAGVFAAAHDGDGDVGGDAVQIVLIRQSSVPFRPLVLPPALALQTFAVRMLCQVLFPVIRRISTLYSSTA